MTWRRPARDERRDAARALRSVNARLREADEERAEDLLDVTEVLPALACWPRRST